MNKMKKINFVEVYKMILCIFPIILFIGMFILGNEKMVIKDITPNQLSVTNEKIVLSVYGKGFKEKDIIYINGREQETTYGNEGWLTCFITKEIHSETQEAEVEVKRTNTIINRKSNEKILKIAQ